MSDDIWQYYSRDFSAELESVTAQRDRWKQITYIIAEELSVATNRERKIDQIITSAVKTLNERNSK